MDNAVKALIIAGAILIAILLIGVGITIFNAASRPLDQGQAQTLSEEVKMFNDPILSCLGQGISGSQVKTLVSTIITSNSQNPDHVIKIKKGKNAEETAAKDYKMGQIDLKKKYNAYEDAFYDDGFIKLIVIEEAAKPTATT